MKSLQKEQDSTNLLLWPPICWNKPPITPKWFNSLDTNCSDTALCCLSDKQYQQIFLTVDQNNFFKQNTISIILWPLWKANFAIFCTLFEIVKQSNRCSTGVLTLVMWTKVCGCGLRPFKCDDPPFTTHNKGCVVNGPAEYEVHLAKAYKRYTILRLLNSKLWIG